MASLTQWTWVWVNSRSWWWTRRAGVLQSIGSQRVGHDCVTELNWIELCIFSPSSTIQGFYSRRTIMVLLLAASQNLHETVFYRWPLIRHLSKEFPDSSCLWVGAVFHLESCVPSIVTSSSRSSNICLFKEAVTELSYYMQKCLDFSPQHCFPSLHAFIFNCHELSW